MASASLPGVAISEIANDTPGRDLGGPSPAPSSGLDDLSRAAVELDRYPADTQRCFEIGSAGVANVDPVALATGGLQNGAEAAMRAPGDAADLAGAALSARDPATVLDAAAPDADDADPRTALGLSVQDEQAAGDGKDGKRLGRLPDDVDGTCRVALKVGALLDRVAFDDRCGQAMGAIEGRSDRADHRRLDPCRLQRGGRPDRPPAAGQTVTIDAAVTADHRTGGVKGSPVREQTGEGDDVASEGILICDPIFALDVAVGDLARVAGVAPIGAAAPDALPAAVPTVEVMRGAAGGQAADLEAVEGMIVTISPRA